MRLIIKSLYTDNYKFVIPGTYNPNTGSSACQFCPSGKIWTQKNNENQGMGGGPFIWFFSLFYSSLLQTLFLHQFSFNSSSVGKKNPSYHSSFSFLILFILILGTYNPNTSSISINSCLSCPIGNVRLILILNLLHITLDYYKAPITLMKAVVIANLVLQVKTSCSVDIDRNSEINKWWIPLIFLNHDITNHLFNS